MKVIGILKKQDSFYYIRCNEGKFPITLTSYIRGQCLITLNNLPLRMLDAAVNLTATATVDFNRPCDVERFDFWLKNDLEIVHCLLKYYAEKRFSN